MYDVVKCLLVTFWKRGVHDTFGGGNVGGGSGTVRYLPTYARKYISNMLFFMYDLCRLNSGFANDRSGKGRVRLFKASCK